MKKRLTIGVITAECYQKFTSHVMQGIIAQSFLCDCDVVFLSSLTSFLPPVGKRFECEHQLYALISSQHFDGFIYDRNYFYNKDIKKLLDKALRKTGKPVMLIESEEDSFFENTVSDDYSAFARVAEHLITVHGYKRINCLTGIKGVPQAEERLQAYIDTLEKYSLRCDPTTYEYGDFWKDAPLRYAEKIISGKTERPEAVMCASDTMAYTLIQALGEAGIRVPEDIAVTGFDGIEPEKGSIRLTSFRKSGRQLGSEVFRRLYRIMTGKTCKRATDKSSGLIIGTSCGCTRQPPHHKKTDRYSSMYEMYFDRFYYGSFCNDLLDTDSLRDMMMTVNGDLYHIYGWHRFDVFVTDDDLSGSPSDSLSGGSMIKNILHSDRSGGRFKNKESFPLSELPLLLKSERYPTACYINILCDGKNIFGISSLSFGKRALCYDKIYLKFLLDLRIALCQLAVRSKGAVRDRPHNSELYAELCEIRSSLKAHPENAMTVSEIARKVHISRSYLHRMYHSFFGKGIVEELISFRINKARRLLEEGDLSVAEIAEKCGYSNYNHFVRQFKETEGMTPSEYRKK